MKIAVIFNTCGISGRENYINYISSIESFLNQNFLDFRVIVSSCFNSLFVRKTLMKHFGNRISYNFIDHMLPVNITFNKTAQVVTEAWKDIDTYLYVDSGINLQTDLNGLDKLYSLHKSGPFGMTCSRIDCDPGYWLWFGENIDGWSPYKNPSPQEDYECSKKMFENGNFIIPIGKTVNLHFQLFDNFIYKNFNKKIMPDIFASHSTEGTFTFLNACLNKKFIICKDVIAQHFTSMDGGSSGFRPEFENIPGYQHTIKFSNRKIMEIVDSIEALTCGFGYEECQKILMHDSNKFNKEGFSICPDLLKKFMLNFYLTKDEFDYSKINNLFII